MSIRTEELRKQYGAVKALDGLTLQAEDGSVYGFLGPNGAGKSTTIRILTGLAHASGGRAWVAGEDIALPGRVTRKIGYLPEEPAFYGWMTPLEMLDHIGRVFGLPSAQRAARAKELLEQVGLAQAAKRRIAGFSRGMRQRLGLAQALINRPEVVLLDEPASALDPAGRKEVLDLVRDLRGQCTVFMSTHILADVERVCDTVGIITAGRLVAQARQAELMARYTIPAFELECEPAARAEFSAWVEGLRGLSPVSGVVLDGTSARVAVESVELARQAILESAAAGRVALRRFEVVTPSLEDVFLKLVNGEEPRP